MPTILSNASLFALMQQHNEVNDELNRLEGYGQLVDTIADASFDDAMPILDVCCMHLQHAILPDCRESKDVRKDWMLLSTLIALSGMNHLSTARTWYPGFSELFCEYWTDIFKWLAYWCTACHEGKVRPTTGADELSATVTALVTGVLICSDRDPRLSKVFFETEGVIAIAAMLWEREELDGVLPNLDEYPNRTKVLTNALVPQNLTALDEVLAATKGDCKRVARTMVSRLRRALQPSPLRFEPAAVHTYVGLISHVSYQDGLYKLKHPYFPHPLGQAVESANCVAALTAAIVVYPEALSRFDDVANVRLILKIIDMGFTFVYRIMDSGDGLRFGKESIQNGLLRAIFNCIPYYDRLHEPTRRNIAGLLTKLLPKFLIYRSVLHVMKPELARLRSQEELLRGTALDVHWRTFRDMALQRLYDKVAHQEYGLTYCAHCYKYAREVELKSCAGCKAVLYCSEECHRTGWPQHKEICQSICDEHQRAALDYEAMTRSDTKFIGAVAMRDIARQADQILNEATRSYKSLSPKDLCVQADYTVFPPVFKVMPLLTSVRALKVSRKDLSPTASTYAAVVRDAMTLQKTSIIVETARNTYTKEQSYFVSNTVFNQKSSDVTSFALTRNTTLRRVRNTCEIIPTWDKVTKSSKIMAFEFELHSPAIHGELERLLVSKQSSAGSARLVECDK